MRPRVVLDTSVLVAALRSSRGASSAVLGLLGQRRITALVSPAIFFEYEDVLKREDQRLIHQFGYAEIDALLVEFARFAEPVRIYYNWRPQLTDAGDEMILEAALNGRADAIVTHNLKDFQSVQKSFGLRVLSPSDLLKEVTA